MYVILLVSRCFLHFLFPFVVVVVAVAVLVVFWPSLSVILCLPFFLHGSVFVIRIIANRVAETEKRTFRFLVFETMHTKI